MVKVSVIVPVYNVEDYLDKCLQSLINQTLTDIEIIVVNDGSTDNSQKVIDKYTGDKRVKAYMKGNGGVSDTRNYGMQFASGEYIGFIDSDDFVDLDMYENMYRKAIEDDSDIVECNLRHTYPNGEDVEIGKKIYEKKEMLMFGRTVIWNRIFNRKWLLDTHVKFPVGLINEDVEFSLKLIPHIRKFSYVDPAYIHYVQRGTSLHNKSTLKTLDIFKVLENIRSHYKTHGFYDEYKESYEFFVIRILLCSTLLRMSRISDKKERKMALRMNWEFLNSNVPEWKQNKMLSEFHTTQTMYIRTINKTTYQIYSKAFPIASSVKETIISWFKKSYKFS